MSASSPSGTPLPPPRPWRLVRAADGKLAGVCAGLAGAAAVDVTLVRLAFVLAGLSGFGIIVYLVLALVMPKQNPWAGDYVGPAPAETMRWIRIALVVGTIGGLIGVLADGTPFNDGGGFVLGLILVTVGAAIIWHRRGGRVPDQWPWMRRTAGAGDAPTANAGAAVAWGSSPGHGSSSGGSAWGPPNPPSSETTSVHPHMPAPTPAMPSEPRGRSLSGSAIVARVLGWLAVIASVATMVAIVAVVNVGALSLPWSGLFFALGVAAVVNLVVWSASARQAMPVLVAMALVLAAAGAVAAFGRWNGEIGETVRRPLAATEIPERYEFAIGHQVIDLRELSSTTAPLQLRVDQGIGLLEVVVPDGARVVVDASVDAGVIDFAGNEVSGVNVDMSRSDGTSETARYELDLDLGFGRIAVCRASDAVLVGGTPGCGS